MVISSHTIYSQDRYTLELQAVEERYWERSVSRSACRFFLLACLQQRPMHGYEVGKAIRRATQACCEPTDAMIYPALRELMEQGLITCRAEQVGGRRRKVCSLTPRGDEAYRAAARVWGRLLPGIHEAITRGNSESCGRP